MLWFAAGVFLLLATCSTIDVLVGGSSVRRALVLWLCFALAYGIRYVLAERECARHVAWVRGMANP